MNRTAPFTLSIPAAPGPRRLFRRCVGGGRHKASRTRGKAERSALSPSTRQSRPAGSTLPWREASRGRRRRCARDLPDSGGVQPRLAGRLARAAGAANGLVPADGDGRAQQGRRATDAHARERLVPACSLPLREPPAHLRPLRSPARALLDTVNAADVSGVRANKRFRTERVNSLPLIRQPETAAAGFTGAGTYVAVLDSGVRYRKSAFGCRKPGKPASCRVAMTWDQAKNDLKLDDDGHCTSVSGHHRRRTAGSELIVADAFDKQGYTTTKIVSKAIDRIVRLKRRGLNVRAINLSLGDSSAHTGPCADSAYAPAFALARSAGILPVVAAGNVSLCPRQLPMGLDYRHVRRARSASAPSTPPQWGGALDGLH